MMTGTWESDHRNGEHEHVKTESATTDTSMVATLSSDVVPSETIATPVLINGQQTFVPLDRAAALNGGYVVVDGTVSAEPTGGVGGPDGRVDAVLAEAPSSVGRDSPVPVDESVGGESPVPVVGSVGLESPVVVHCRDLGASRIVGGRPVAVLRGVELTVRAGAFVVITGRSGSGKSTLLESLAGLRRIDSGDVFVDGTPIAHASDAELAELRATRLGFLHQHLELIDELSASENVELPLLLNGWSRVSARAQAQSTLASIGVDRHTDRISELSGGERRLVAMARALVGEPAVLWADEPTSGIDPETAAGMVEQLLEQCRHGLAVIAVSHDPLVLRVATARYQLRDGRLHAG